MAKAPNNKKLIAVSILAYLLFLVALLPINFVYKLLEPKGLPVEIIAVEGTLWQGAVTLKHPYTGQLQAQWDLDVMPLLTGNLAADIQAKGNYLDVDANLRANALSRYVSIEGLTGVINETLVNQVIKRTRRTMQGDIELNVQSLEYDFNDKTAHNVTGNIVWLGGEVSYPKGRQIKRTTMPMLVAQLSEQQGKLVVDLNTTEGKGVAQAYLNTDGWGGVSIYKRMLDLINEPWPGGKVTPDDVIFEVSEKVLP